MKHAADSMPPPFIFLNYQGEKISSSASLAPLLSSYWCHKEDGGIHYQRDWDKY